MRRPRPCHTTVTTAPRRGRSDDGRDTFQCAWPATKTNGTTGFRGGTIGGRGETPAALDQPRGVRADKERRDQEWQQYLAQVMGGGNSNLEPSPSLQEEWMQDVHGNWFQISGPLAGGNSHGQQDGTGSSGPQTSMERIDATSCKRRMRLLAASTKWRTPHLQPRGEEVRLMNGDIRMGARIPPMANTGMEDGIADPAPSIITTARREW